MDLHEHTLSLLVAGDGVLRSSPRQGFSESSVSSGVTLCFALSVCCLLPSHSEQQTGTAAAVLGCRCKLQVIQREAGRTVGS